MAEFEALFSEGTKLTIQADSMTVADGVVKFDQQVDGVTTTVCALSVNQLLFVFNTEADVTVEEVVYEDDEDED